MAHRTVLATVAIAVLFLSFLPLPEANPASTEVYYGNCDAVRAAGVALLKQGEPGYRAGLDRDRDGWACE